MIARGFLKAALAFFAVGVVLFVTATIQHNKIGEPDKLAVSDAQAKLDLLDERIVTVSGRIDQDRKLYNIVAYSSELLKPWSPENGIPLSGPDALPKEQWKSIEKSYVVAQTSGEPVVSIYETSHLGTGSDTLSVTSRRIFARLRVPNLWALSDSHLQFPTLSGEERPLEEEETKWLSSNEFKGSLYRLDTYTSGSLDAAEMKRLFSKAGLDPEMLSNAWLIETLDPHIVPVSGSGWHVYVPFENENRIWVQLPANTELARLPSPLTGLWIPPAQSHFTPDDKDGKVALLIVAPEVQSRFVEERWALHWGKTAWLAAFGAFGVAGLLLLIGFIRARYFKPGFPTFLQPYAKYLIPEPVWLYRSRVALGVIAAAMAVSLFLAHMIVRDNIRFNRTNFSSTSLELADAFAIIPITWVMIALAQSFFARNGASVMRNDTRRPVLYLRSFQADSPFWRSFRGSEHHLMRALHAVGPTVAIGVPDRLIPPIGAARLKVAHEHWKDVVTQLAANAQLIVLRLGKTEGFGWEMQHLVATAAAERLFIYVNKQERGEAYKDLRVRANTILPQPLPEDIKRASLIGFSPDWQPILLEPAGPSMVARIRNWMGNGEGPGLREALQQKLAIGPMPFSVWEWGSMIFFGGFVFSILRSLVR
jgi:hypothetical protein